MCVPAAYGMEISRHSNTKGLVADKDFRAYVKHYFSGYTGAYFWDAPVYQQALAGLGGPPGPVEHLNNGLLFVAGCREQSCIEKVAFVTNGAEGSFGFVSYFCPGEGGLQYSGAGCLVIFDRHDKVALVRQLRSWSASLLGHDVYFVANRQP